MNYELASFFKRLVAYLIDILPISFLVVGICMLFFGFGGNIQEALNAGKSINEFLKNQADSPDRTMQIEQVIMANVSFAIWIIYSIVMETSIHQGTFGKKLMGIKVVGETGEKLTFEESFKRNTTKSISWFIMNLGFFWMLFDEERQTWHDKIASTFVVESKPIEVEKKNLDMFR
jgi:uncharacterized RDD family membrane protein YckC